MKMKTRVSIAAALLASSITTAAQSQSEPGGNAALRRALQQSEHSSQRSIDAVAEQLDFERFKAGVYKEPFEGGGYIVDGDVFIPTEEELRTFYLRGIIARSSQSSKFFMLARRYDGYDDIWNGEQKRSITYCVSTSFGSNYDKVVRAMAAATTAWEQAADIDFIHLPAIDGSCQATSLGVVFDVRPVNVAGAYYARAFYPQYRRSDRNMLIDTTGLSFPEDGAIGMTLTGVLRHELGHTIGARHEHTRPESGKCFEDTEWTPVTNYDAFSVMHYPDCNGKGDWTLRLTRSDRNGAACIYGPASGFVIDTAVCAPRATDPMRQYSAF